VLLGMMLVVFTTSLVAADNECSLRELQLQQQRGAYAVFASDKGRIVGRHDEVSTRDRRVGQQSYRNSVS